VSAKEDFIIGLGSFILLNFAAIGAIKVANNYWRSEAVRHHAAEYYLDANHVRQWRWIDEKEKQ